MYYLSESVLQKLEEMQKKDELCKDLFTELRGLIYRISGELITITLTTSPTLHIEYVENALKLSNHLQALVVLKAHERKIKTTDELLDCIQKLRNKLKEYIQYRRLSLLVRVI